MKRAKAKVWVKADGTTLVADGHAEASTLVASSGKVLLDSDTSAFTNTATFFDTIAPVESRVSNSYAGQIIEMTPGAIIP